MKKLAILITILTLTLILLLVPKAHAYTLGDSDFYYNQVTNNEGRAELLDISNSFIEYMYFDLASSHIYSWETIRIVFSNTITTDKLPLIVPNSSGYMDVFINFYDASHNLLMSSSTYFSHTMSLSYFETNFRSTQSYNNLDYITISLLDINGYLDEDVLHMIMTNVIIGYSSSQIIYNPILNGQYEQGWIDAMESKVTQIWSLWSDIFDTFMGVFNVFSIKLMGDITIGHLALVPLVLGLIGFIYALGGKRGR